MIATIVLVAIMAACAAGTAGIREANNRIQVFGVQLGSTEDAPWIRGAPATEEPCLKGRERYFDTLAISIGYGHNGKIRKIATRNPGTTMFGIRPGDGFDASREKALAAGFKETGAAHRFSSDCCSLTLLVDEGGHVFGMTMELQD